MKVSLNWLKQFAEIDLPIDGLVEKIGTQLGAVEEVVDWGKRYKNIVVAQIKEKSEHPNADKLAVYQVEAGKNKLVQVVAGDKNLQIGDKVAWMPPGAYVPATFEREPLKLEARQLRGEMSNGMLGSAYELALGSEDGRVQVLDTAAANGTDLADAYELNDTILDIENKMFTHRPDCFGILGVAREISGILRKPFRSPDWFLTPQPLKSNSPSNLAVAVYNKIPDLVPRFMAQTIEGVKVSSTPLLTKSYLARVGIKPQNSVVDITNYIMHLTGQPTHAFDYEKLKSVSTGSPTIGPRMAKKGEKLTLLGGKTINLTADDIVIATDKQAVALAGIMGGADTEVSGDTRNLVVECAAFDRYKIHGSAMRHGLFTDAATRFSKGQSPRQQPPVLVKVVEKIGGRTGSIYDNQKTPDNKPVLVSADFINDRLGSELSIEYIATLLQNVEFGVAVSNNACTITPPFWRTDIAIAEDIVEDVGRLHGYDSLPLALPRRLIRPTKRNQMLDFKSEISEALVKLGASETLTYSFVRGDLLDASSQDRKKAFKIANALSPDLQYYRVSLTPSLLEKTYLNLKSDYLRFGEDNEFALFEIGKTHVKGLNDQEEPKVPVETQRLALVYAADSKTAGKKYDGAAFYQAAAFLRGLMRSLNINFIVEPCSRWPRAIQDKQLAAPYHSAKAGLVKVDGEPAGIVGELNVRTRQALKLPEFSAAFELDLDKLVKCERSPDYAGLSRFPRVFQDITFNTPEEVTYAGLLGAVSSELDKLSGNQLLVNVRAKDVYRKKAGKGRHITFRLSLAHNERTLTTSEVNRLLNDLATVIGRRLGAQRV